MIQIFHQLKIQLNKLTKNNFHLSSMNKPSNLTQTNKSSIQFNSTRSSTLDSIKIEIIKWKKKV